jgi:hypothetical protein
MDRRTLGLGVAAMVAVGVAVGVTIAKHPKHTSRDDVAAYVTQVNTVQDRLRYPLTKVLVAYRAFANTQTLGAQQARQLATAQKTLLRVQHRVAALQPPVQAKHLQVLMVRLLGDEAAVTHEVALFAAFVPKFKKALNTVHVASAQLAASLGRIETPKSHALKGSKKQVLAAQQAFAAAATTAARAQADAVSAYDAKLQVALRQLQGLTPPPAFAPAYRTQRFTLRSTRAAGAKLAAGLRNTSRADVAELGRAFTVASRKSQAISAQRTEIASIKAYNSRVRALGKDARAVQAELGRLQRVLP